MMSFSWISHYMGILIVETDAPSWYSNVHTPPWILGCAKDRERSTQQERIDSGPLGGAQRDPATEIEVGKVEEAWP